MKLRQKSKRDQVLDAAASVAKTWSEWRLGEKVAKTATKATKRASKKAAKATKRASKKAAKRSGTGLKQRKPLRIAGAIALLGGIGAAVAKKLGGGKAEPLYTPPGPAADMSPPPPSAVFVEDLAGQPAVNEPIGFDEPPASGAPQAEDRPPTAGLAPAPEDLVSDTADPAPGDADEPTDRPA